MLYVNVSLLWFVLLVMVGLLYGEGFVEVVVECGDCVCYWFGEFGGLMGVW